MKRILRVLSLICLIAIPSLVQAAPFASFTTSNNRAGCGALVCTFVPTVTGCSGTQVLTWYYIPTGTTDTATGGATHSFTVQGCYDVVLKVVCGGETTWVVNPSYVCVNPPPTVDFTTTNPSADLGLSCAPKFIQFVNATTGDTSCPTHTWTWLITGPTSATFNTTNPSYTFTVPGNYTVRLIYSSPCACFGTLERVSYIHIDSPATACFSRTDTAVFCSASASAPATPVFSAACSHGASTYGWYLNGALVQSGSSSTFSPNLTASGNYTVTMTAYSAAGCPTASSTSIVVHVGSFVTNFLPSATTICQGSSTTFADNSTVDTGAFVNYHFYAFGPGPSYPYEGDDASQIATFTFTTPGDHIIVDSTSNAYGCFSSTRRHITVLPSPVVSFSADSLYKCSPNMVTHFVATPTVASSTYTWSFAGCPTCTYTALGSAGGASVTYTYTATGNYNPRLTITDNNGCSASLTQPAYIQIHPPTVTISAAVDSGCSPINVAYHVSISNVPIGTPFLVDSLNFYDAAATPSHIFGCVGCTDLVHSYTTGGVKYGIVKWHLPAYLGGCSGIDSVSVLIGATHPIYNFTHPDSVCPHTVVNFASNCTNCTFETLHIMVSPTDSIPTIFNPTYFHAYDLPNISFPTFRQWPVRWTGSVNGCTDTLFDSVYVFPPVIFNSSLSSSTPNCAKRDSFRFQVNGVTAPSHLYYTWNFGDGNFGTSGSVFPSTVSSIGHQYGGTSGTYTVVVTAHDSAANHTCTNTDTLVVTFGPNPALRNWTLDNQNTISIPLDSVGCKNDVFAFTGPLQPNGTPYYQYSWTFGDGGSPYVSGPTPPASEGALHGYSSTGVFTVTVVVTNNQGCRDTARKRTVKVTGPNGGFSASDTTICVGSTVTFTDLNTDPGSSINYRLWCFNAPPSVVGGPPSTPASGTVTMTRTFSIAGDYHITLNDSDVNHCASFDTKTVHAIQPNAYFNSPDSADQLCAGIPISFFDTNTHCSYTWNFGDGPTTTSATGNVTHIYTANGIYSVTVTISSDGTFFPVGCSASFTRPNFIHIASLPGIAITNYADSGSVGCSPLHLGVGPVFSAVTSSYIYTWTIASIPAPPPPIYFDSTHTFLFTDITNPGDHLVTLTAHTARGCRDSVSQHYFVGGPAGTISIDDTSGCAPFEAVIRFNNTGSVSSSSTYIWTTCPYGTVTTTTDTVHVTYTTPGTYCPPTLIITSGGCANPVFSTDSITVHPTPNVSIIPVSRICYGATTTLAATSDMPVTYSWAPSAGLACPTCQIISPSSILTTTYTVTGTTAFGCSDTGVSTVTVDSQIVITITGKDSICIGLRDTLTAHSAAGSTFLWDAITGVSDPTSPTVVIITSTSQTYWVHVTNAAGCTDSASFRVTINPTPVMHYTPDPAYVCNGSSTQLNVTGAASYLWEPRLGLSCDSCSNPITTIGNNIIYSVTGTSNHGCRDSITVPVTVYFHLPTSIRSDTVICAGDAARLWATGGESYIWTPAGTLDNPNVYAPIATPTVTTVYSVYIKENPCFTDTQHVKVTVIPLPILHLPPTTTIIAGNSVQLYADPLNSVTLTSYAWTPADSTLTCNDCPRPIATPIVTTTYSVTATTIEGCAGHGTVTIKLLCETSQVFIPNTFTPNGDGNNDRFFISGKGLGMITRMAIYNRWGEVVYEANNIRPNDAGQGWDGTFRGEVVAPDVFVYVLEVQCSTGEPFTFRGDISLVR